MTKVNCINKIDLAHSVADQCNMPHKHALDAVSAMFGRISEHLDSGGTVQVNGFGSFSVVTRKARKGRNPQTGEELEIPEHPSVKFKPSSKLLS